jgi:hypothetical protein
MNTKLTSLIVLGTIAMTAPAFAAKPAASTPAKTAKISAPAPKSKAKVQILKKKTAVVSVKKAAK